MGGKAFEQQIHKHVLGAGAEMGLETVGEQQRHARGDTLGERRFGRWGLPDVYRNHAADGARRGAELLAPVVVGGITGTYLLQVRLQCQAT